jgi:hypothetical protein
LRVLVGDAPTAGQQEENDRSRDPSTYHNRWWDGRGKAVSRRRGDHTETKAFVSCTANVG